MNLKIMLASFALVFVAELGDKTQLTALAFTTASRSPWMVFVGTSLALVCTTALAVIFGELLSRVLPVNVLHIASGVMFVLMGLVLLVNVARKAEVPVVSDEAETPETFVAPSLSRSALFSMITRQATVFEDEIIDYLDAVAEQVADPVDKRTVLDVIGEDQRHKDSLSVLRRRHADTVESIDENLSVTDLEVLRERTPAPGNLPAIADISEVSRSEDLAQVLWAAVASEEALAEFYLSLSRMAKIHAVRDAFRLLARDDLRHAETLCDLAEKYSPAGTV
ncbi:MAG: TMEM165/GDT1 family protein [Candidatus Pacebacteria bacterium]|nr:TMEM165/GDT1 family protein [Candidatus Paceibacterota bacterium]